MSLIFTMYFPLLTCVDRYWYFVMFKLIRYLVTYYILYLLKSIVSSSVCLATFCGGQVGCIVFQIVCLSVYIFVYDLNQPSRYRNETEGTCKKPPSPVKRHSLLLTVVVEKNPKIRRPLLRVEQRRRRREKLNKRTYDGDDG